MFLSSYHFQPKLLIGIALAGALLWEWRKGYFRGWEKFQPGPFFKSCRVPLLGFPIVVAALLPFDPFLLKAVQLLGARLAWFSDFGAFLGRNSNFWAFLIGTYLVSLAARQGGASKRILGVIVGSALAGLTCYLLKFVFLRARPSAGLGAFSFFNWDGLLHDTNEFQSLPSGDMGLMGGAACYLFYAVRNRYLRWLPFLFPLATLFARTAGNRHWFSDLVFSLGVSLIVSRAIWDCQKRSSPSCRKTCP